MERRRCPVSHRRRSEGMSSTSEHMGWLPSLNGGGGCAEGGQEDGGVPSAARAAGPSVPDDDGAGGDPGKENDEAAALPLCGWWDIRTKDSGTIGTGLSFRSGGAAADGNDGRVAGVESYRVRAADGARDDGAGGC